MGENLSMEIDELSEYLEWVKGIARWTLKRYSIGYNDIEDYQSAGFIGLMEAFQRFDPSRKISLKQFAFARVRGAIIDAIRSSSYLNTTTYRHLKRFCKLETNCDEQKKIKVHISKNRDTRIMAYKIESLSDDFHEITNQENPACILEKKQEKLKLFNYLLRLPEKEKFILKRHYYHEISLSQISRESGNGSRSWASRLHLRALDLMRRQYKIL